VRCLTQARRYFEGGGVEDGRTEPAAPVSAEGTIDQLADQCKAALYAKLPCIGHGPQLPGEALSEAKGCHKPKPEARVRLFALYGVADVAMSLQPWIDRAPEWLEVRLVDLPGHGFRQRDSALLSCAEQGQLNESALVAQGGPEGRRGRGERGADHIRTSHCEYGAVHDGVKTELCAP